VSSQVNSSHPELFINLRTIRKIGANSIGVEKIFPLNAPVISKIKIKKTSFTRRAKLYYLRDLIGKAATKIRDAKTI